ncbi:MAG: hypothetical protein ACXVIY_06835 [Mucilaginibacter sp.]
MNPTKSIFSSLDEINNLIAEYFIHIQGRTRTLRRKVKDANGVVTRRSVKITEREPEPPTATGLAYFLGFNSMQQFEDYETNGEFADQLKRGTLRIIAEYEKKLHLPSSAGAIFMLRSLGWNNRATEKETGNLLPVEMVETGHKPASTEKEVVL